MTQRRKSAVGIVFWMFFLYPSDGRRLAGSWARGFTFLQGMKPSSSMKYSASVRMMLFNGSLNHDPARPITDSSRRLSVVTTGACHEQTRPAGVWPTTPAFEPPAAFLRGRRLPLSSRQVGVRKPRSSTSEILSGFWDNVKADTLLSSGAGCWLKVRKNQPCTV